MAPVPSCQTALTLHQQGKLTEAIADYRACLKAHPAWAEPRSNLGAALAASGRYDEAAAEYRSVLRADPYRADVRRNLALAYYKSGRLNEAIPELDKVLQQRPGDRDTAILLADTHFRMGEYGKAAELLQPFAERASDDKALAYLLGTALIRSGKPEQGQVYVERILAAGDTAEARLMVGLAALERGEYEAAHKELQRAASMNGKLPGVQTYLGLSLLGRNRIEEARLAFESAGLQDPYDYEASLQLGVIEKEAGNFERALAHLERARRARPGSLKAQFQTAVVLLALRRNDEALKELQALLKEAPEFAEGHAAIATAYYRLKQREKAEHHRSEERRLREGNKK